MSPPNLPQRILLAVESAALARPALERVAGLASRAHATLDLLHVWEPIPFTPPEAAFYVEGEAKTYREIATSTGKLALQDLSQRAAELGLRVGQQHVLEGLPAATIAQVATDAKCELIVLTSHQAHGVGRWLQGSVSEKVVRLAACPVLTVPLHP